MKKRFVRRMISWALALCLILGAALGEYSSISLGDDGDDVLQLQLALLELGYELDEANGFFGSDTEAALRTFQEEHQLEVTGEADPQTQELLFSLLEPEETPAAFEEVTLVHEGSSEAYDERTVTYWNGYLVPSRTMSRGYTGADVQSVQQRLLDLGYYSGTPTATYDTVTIAAVKSFQSRNSLTSDGYAGTRTYNKLYSDDAIPADGYSAPVSPTSPAYTIPSRTLRSGMSGDDVKSVQLRLKELGYFSGTATGTYGSITVSAMKKFQSRNGLTADGVAGTKTYTVLFSSTARPAAGVTPSPTPSPTPAATPSSTVPTRTLRSGAAGQDVLWLQERLIELRYNVQTSSVYDTLTESAVKSFQSRNSLTADGIAGSSTLKKLFSDSAVPLSTPTPTPKPTATPRPTATAKPTATPTAAPQWSIPTRTLRSGMSGDDVYSVQVRLQELYYTVNLTGVYDSVTVAAMKAFQKTNSLTADGVAGTRTYAKLFSTAAKPTTTPIPTATPWATATPKYTAEPTAEPTPAPTTHIPGRTLRSGSSGEDVVWVQERLTELGYYAGSLSGTYSTETVNAVKAFQRRNGLTADGVAGSRTYAVLFAEDARPAEGTQTATPVPTATPAPTSLPEKPTRTLKKGLYGDDVKALQRRLTELKYFDTPVSGLYSTATINAVKAFQKANSLTADGVAGTRTLNLLFSASAKATKAPVYDLSPAKAETVYTTVSSGSSTTEVKKLQTALKALGYTVSVNGSMDATTTAAVRAFQTNNYLSIDGVAGPETLALLYGGSAAMAGDKPVESYATLSVNTGAGSSAVTRLQTRLKELGYDVTVNGKYDAVTHNAVVAFQQRNGLLISGIASGATQNILYNTNAKNASTAVYELPSGLGRIKAPEKVELLWWYTEVKPSIKSGQTVVVYDPETNISWNIKLYSLGKHADSQPASFIDTQLMNRSFGGTSWTCHPVYVKLPDGRWVLAAMHNYPHLYGSISSNGFGGHLCIHFLRTYAECIAAGDTSYGVEMQDTIRLYWLALTGEQVD